MEIGERLRFLRKDTMHLTLEKFGERIGMKKNSLSQIENGITSLTEQTAKSICREFHVSESWLRTGTGNMFQDKSIEEELSSFLDSIQMDDDGYKLAIVRALSSLDAEQWKVLDSILDRIMQEKDAAKGQADAADRQQERAARHAELDRQMDLEEEAAGESSAS